MSTANIIAAVVIVVVLIGGGITLHRWTTDQAIAPALRSAKTASD
jgi:hypothetical protein